MLYGLVYSFISLYILYCTSKVFPNESDFEPLDDHVFGAICIYVHILKLIGLLFAKFFTCVANYLCEEFNHENRNYAGEKSTRCKTNYAEANSNRFDNKADQIL
jgi:hypothetical protein